MKEKEASLQEGRQASKQAIIIVQSSLDPCNQAVIKLTKLQKKELLFQFLTLY